MFQESVNGSDPPTKNDEQKSEQTVLETKESYSLGFHVSNLVEYVYPQKERRGENPDLQDF